jgi:PAS domain S-box-containing protein
VTGEEAKIIEFNERYLGMWKIPREALESRTLREVWEFMSQNFADPRKFSARLEEIAATEQESSDLLELTDGRVIDRSSKVLTLEGAGAGRVWSFRDVTERHKSEITANRLAALVASSDDAIIGKDLNLIVTSWNSGAERIFGYTAEEMIGTSIMRLIPPDRLEEETEILSRIRRGQRSDHFETVRLAKDGRRLNLSMTISPIMDASGHVIGASKVARDISERKKAEEALKKAMEEAEVANRERLQLLDSEREARSQAERESHEGRISGDA